LMRRALAIQENGLGADHPDVAVSLNNLAKLLQATNRLAEAEPLLRRAWGIQRRASRKSGYDLPNLHQFHDSYENLLHAMGLGDKLVQQKMDVCLEEEGAREQG